MHCSNCGNLINPGDMFCANCGIKILNQNDVNNNMNGSGAMPNKHKKMKMGKIFGIISVVVVGTILLFILLFILTSLNSKKFVCKSDIGNITILYNESGINGYTANGISFDFEQAKKYAKEVGMDKYIDEFNAWFVLNTSGSCTKNGVLMSGVSNNQEEKFDEEDLATGRRVGSDEFGYITIPNDWADFVSLDGGDTLQYSYASIYIATLYAVDTTQIDAYSYSSNIMLKLQNDGVEELQGATVNVGEYTAYQVYGYYPADNVWLVCWFFEAEDGKTHYISIEGPDRKSEHFNIPDTFSLVK